MKLLIIILCLCSERFLIHAMSYKRFNWFERYCVVIKDLLNKKNIFLNDSLLLALIVMPIVLIVGIVYLLIDHMFWGALGFLASLLLFFYCLGPQNPFYPIKNEEAEVSNDDQVKDYLTKINNQLFAVVFWYVIGGPIAVLVFRLISLAQKTDPVEHIAKDCTEVLEWIPARLTALLFLLVGNFQSGIKNYVHLFLTKPALNNQLITECSMSSLRANDQEELSLPIAENLVVHAVIMLLVIIAILTLTAWL